MSLEYAFRPIEDPEEGLKADQKAVSLAQEFASDESKYAKVLKVLEESPLVRNIYEWEKEGSAIMYERALAPSFSRIRRSVTELITVIESEEFRDKPLDYEVAYQVVREIRKFDPKTWLITGLQQFLKHRQLAVGAKSLIYVYRAAWAAFRLGRIDYAIKLLLDTINKSKQVSAAHLGELLAFFYRFRKEYDKEKQVLERVAATLPLRSRARHRLGYFYKKEGEEKKAERAKFIYTNGALLHRSQYSIIEAVYFQKNWKFVPNTNRSRYYISLAAILLHPNEF